MIIKLKNVTKRYKNTEKPAVNNVNLEIKTGKIATLLGPSGCGKTTILRLIAGLEHPDSGIIKLAGEAVSAKHSWVPPEKRKIGLVFQDYALFPHLNVKQNITFGIKEKNKEKIEHSLELVGLTEQAGKNPAELSGGQQQRVALARALIRNPRLIMLDEPFNNLDKNLREKMQNEVYKIIKKTETTALFVTHDQEEALTMSDTIFVMNSGKIIQKGTPREIYEHPETRFVASFVGQSNILEGTISSNQKYVITDIGKIPCQHTHNSDPGSEVLISIRPESFELDSGGKIEGVIKNTSYKGKTIDAVINVKGNKKEHELLVHVHPENKINLEDELNFKVLSDFVAVIENNLSSN